MFFLGGKVQVVCKFGKGVDEVEMGRLDDTNKYQDRYTISLYNLQGIPLPRIPRRLSYRPVRGDAQPLLRP